VLRAAKDALIITRIMPKAKIMIVEDEPMLALELKEDLIELGYEIPDVLSDGDTVLAAVAKTHPDLIMMDIKLYGYRDGIDAATRLRAFYKTPVIFLTSYPLSEIGDRLDRLDGVIYIGKPYKIENLSQIIESALAGKN